MWNRRRLRWYRKLKSACQASVSQRAATAHRRCTVRAAAGCAWLSSNALRNVAMWSAMRHANWFNAVGASAAASPGSSGMSSSAAPRSRPSRSSGASSAARKGSGSASSRASAPLGRARLAAWRSGSMRARDAANARCAAPLSKGACTSSMQACATASRWPLRLPLSTVETYIGSSAALRCVSYQFRKCPRWRGNSASVAKVASSRASRSCVPTQPNCRAQAALSMYSPMFVGEVRCATSVSGVSCRLSGGRKLSSAPTQRSNSRQVSRAMSSR